MTQLERRVRQDLGDRGQQSRRFLQPERVGRRRRWRDPGCGHRQRPYPEVHPRRGLRGASWGGSGAEDGKFLSPDAIAVDDSGAVYVVDSARNGFQKFDADGIFIGKDHFSGSDPGAFDFPYGIAVNSAGAVYVSDSVQQPYPDVCPRDINPNTHADTDPSLIPFTKQFFCPCHKLPFFIFSS